MRTHTGEKFSTNWEYMEYHGALWDTSMNIWKIHIFPREYMDYFTHNAPNPYIPREYMDYLPITHLYHMA